MEILFACKFGRWKWRGSRLPTAFRIDMDVDQLKSWMDHLAQAIIIVNDSGVVVALNHPFQRLTNYSIEEVEGQAFFRFLRLSASFQEIRKKTGWLQGKLRSKEGDWIQTDVHIEKKQELGQTYHIFTFYPKYLSMISQWFAKAPIGMIMVHFERGILWAINSLACSVLGIESDMLYQPIEEVIPKEKEYKRLTSFLKKPQRFHYRFETKWNTKHLLFTAHPCADAKMTCFFIEDTSKVKSLEQQLKYNNRLATIGQIAAGSAHEIRNPLTSIKGFLQVIANKFHQLGYQKEQSYVQVMLKEINRINHLVGELLVLSKPKEMGLTSVEISQVMKEILPIIKNEALLHNIRIHIDYQIPENVAVCADGKLLKQVFLNLCKNAIESMKQEGCLTIRLINKGKKKLLVEFHDTGTGIPKEVQKKIFEPFFTTKENGTGLGLPICKQIMKEIGGRISVSSSKKGTVFRVLLPLA